MMTPQMHHSRPTGGVSGEAEISAFYLRHYPQLRMHAHGLGCDPHTAEDAVQDVFLRLLRHDRLHSLMTLSGQHQQASLRLRLRCHLMNRWRDSRRQRRGGPCSLIPLLQPDGTPMEIADERAPIPGSPPRLSEQSLHNALQILRQELKPITWQRVGLLLQEDETLASHPPQSPATRVALPRARQRLRELLDQ
jgi:DNA-directed RNA polymerase specialized sigma24 family protein